MFDFGLGEMMLLSAIALIAIGPKQLPEVAKTVGKFVGELKRYTGDLTRHVIDAREATNLKLQLNQQLMSAGAARGMGGGSASSASRDVQNKSGMTGAPTATHPYDPVGFPSAYRDPNFNPDQLTFEFRDFIDCYPTSWHSSNGSNLQSESSVIGDNEASVTRSSEQPQ